VRHHGAPNLLVASRPPANAGRRGVEVGALRRRRAEARSVERSDQEVGEAQRRASDEEAIQP
jgi:hypothetical protein